MWHKPVWFQVLGLWHQVFKRCFSWNNIHILQCSIRKKFGDNVFNWGSGRLSQYQQNFIDLYCFAHCSPLLFSCIICSFQQNTKKPIVCLRNLWNSRSSQIATCVRDELEIINFTHWRTWFQQVFTQIHLFSCLSTRNNLKKLSVHILSNNLYVGFLRTTMLHVLCSLCYGLESCYSF